MQLLSFVELDPSQQASVVKDATNVVLNDIVEGRIVFNDHGVQEKVDGAMKYAQDVMRTPWFAHEYVMDKIGTQVNAMGSTRAAACLYAPPGTPKIVRL